MPSWSRSSPPSVLWEESWEETKLDLISLSASAVQNIEVLPWQGPPSARQSNQSLHWAASKLHFIYQRWNFPASKVPEGIRPIKELSNNIKSFCIPLMLEGLTLFLNFNRNNWFEIEMKSMKIIENRNILSELVRDMIKANGRCEMFLKSNTDRCKQ